MLPLTNRAVSLEPADVVRRRLSVESFGAARAVAGVIVFAGWLTAAVGGGAAIFSFAANGPLALVIGAGSFASGLVMVAAGQLVRAQVVVAEGVQEMVYLMRDAPKSQLQPVRTAMPESKTAPDTEGAVLYRGMEIVPIDFGRVRVGSQVFATEAEAKADIDRRYS